MAALMSINGRVPEGKRKIMYHKFVFSSSIYVEKAARNRAVLDGLEDNSLTVRNGDRPGDRCMDAGPGSK
jgi:hypothetical protein